MDDQILNDASQQKIADLAQNIQSALRDCLLKYQNMHDKNVDKLVFTALMNEMKRWRNIKGMGLKESTRKSYAQSFEIGLEITESMNRESAVWYGCIAMKKKNGAPEKMVRKRDAGPIINADSFALSLKEYIEYPFIRSLDTQEKTLIVQEYWKEIMVAMPEAFLDRKNYSIQKIASVAVWHKSLPALYEITGSIQKPILGSGIVPYIVQNLSGRNAADELVSGADFWKSGKNGAIAFFNNGVGRKTLTDKIEQIALEWAKAHR